LRLEAKGSQLRPPSVVPRGGYQLSVTSNSNKAIGSLAGGDWDLTSGGRALARDFDGHGMDAARSAPVRNEWASLPRSTHFLGRRYSGPMD